MDSLDDRFIRQLQAAGIVPQPSFLQGSGLLLGQQITLFPYRLVFRIQNYTLFICSLTRLPGFAPKPASLLRLWRLFSDIFSHFLPELNCIRMLVITDEPFPALVRQRQKLVRLLCEKEAAVICEIDGEPWLEVRRR